MSEEKLNLLRVLSALLHYPDDRLVASLEELRGVVKEISLTEPQEKCIRFLSYLKDTPLIRLQENYTATFDLSPATCLNLTYHKWGDSRDRGTALVGFHSLYHNSGYESKTGELPDYLPLVLEFLSINRQENNLSFLGQYFDQVETIGSRLQANGNHYAGIFGLVVEVFRKLEAEGA